MDFTIQVNSETSSSNKNSSLGKFLIYTTGGLALGVSIVCLPFVSPAFRKICLPYVPATPNQLMGVKLALRGRTGQLLDVGSGDGRIVFSTAKLGFSAHGVELNPVLVYYSRFKAILNQQHKNTTFHRKNLWTFNFAPYENIVIFGVEQMMKDFEKKIVKEVNKGTIVVACRFPLPSMIPVETIGHGVDTVWKYVINI